MTRIGRALAVTALTVGLTPPAPAGASISPPPIDDSRLPPAGSARPPQPTEQRVDCVAVRDATSAGHLLDDVSLVWPLTRGAGQTVAIIDTGVARHRRLPHLVAGGDFVSTGDGTADCDGHGTIVAGLIGASPDPSDGFAGVAPEAALLSIRQSSNKFDVTEGNGGSGVGDVQTLAAAVRLAADMGATVINISSVACLAADTGLDDRALGAALAYAVDITNAVVVSAAGNVGGAGQCPAQNGPDVTVVASPAWYDDYVLTVGSSSTDGSASDFSLAGPWVDVAAPGENVVSLAAAPDGLVDSTVSGARLSGTSYAAPLVSGLAALVRARHPELTARQVMARIEDTARHPAGGWSAALGHGVVDVMAAVGDVAPSVPRPATTISGMPAEQRDREPASPVRTVLLCAGLIGAVAVAGAALGRSRPREDDVAAD
ncbi:type VII secretion-associated serine protease mycosin [Mycolicibacterium obuense]|uniref:type VII secretion-associated serine protease mycosin n=1 Tax=Mycolicibacterium obuense TaxID=1807 RepID=UPI002350657F|nr:type VII secretion-associated serine protease mycosin [Mycolicibacterium obuense]